MNKMKLIAGTILFGSLWGFSENILGTYLHNTGLPAGSIMAGLFAVGFMAISRILYKQRGMQLGMGLVAGALRLFNPFGTCFICSAIAIIAEGLIFEIIWYKLSLDLRILEKNTMSVSMGIITSYCCFVGGYIVTQILTPLLQSAGFHVENLIAFIPQILARGLLAALIGGFVVPAALLIKKIDVATVEDKLYYPITTMISVTCWFAVILNTLFVLKII
ncbi:MAG: hypothetical protein QHH19_06675 [Candidatus Thermoplasmatota archaeon]|jgi:hypothetical protein|nr:hypothetical protein [Candidatus Thermoplasmatota archaeon]